MKVIYDGEWFIGRNDSGDIGYGIRVFLTDGSVLEIADVDCELNEIPQLLSRLRGERVDAEQLRYLVEDYLAGMYDYLR